MRTCNLSAEEAEVDPWGWLVYPNLHWEHHDNNRPYLKMKMDSFLFLMLPSDWQTDNRQKHQERERERQRLSDKRLKDRDRESETERRDILPYTWTHTPIHKHWNIILPQIKINSYSLQEHGLERGSPFSVYEITLGNKSIYIFSCM